MINGKIGSLLPEALLLGSRQQNYQDTDVHSHFYTVGLLPTLTVSFGRQWGSVLHLPPAHIHLPDKRHIPPENISIDPIRLFIIST